jgi:uncharacterized protein YbgA (DUF1722 family)
MRYTVAKSDTRSQYRVGWFTKEKAPNEENHCSTTPVLKHRLGFLQPRIKRAKRKKLIDTVKIDIAM